MELYHRRVERVQLNSIKDSGHLAFKNSFNVNDCLYKMKILNFSDLIQLVDLGFMRNQRSKKFLEDSSILNSIMLPLWVPIDST